MTDLDELEKLEQAADLDDEIFERREMHITCASSPTFPTLTASGNRVAKYLEAALNALPDLIAELRELRKENKRLESEIYSLNCRVAELKRGAA